MEEYDHLPVEDDGEDDIVGLLHDAIAKRSSREGTVKDRFLPLSEEEMSGAAASILDFIKGADSTPCQLVVSREKSSDLLRCLSFRTPRPGGSFYADYWS